MPVTSFQVTADGVGLLRIQREKARNAVHDWVYEGLISGLIEAEADPRCHLVLITGKGDFFCTGADLVQGFDPMVGPLKSKHGSRYDPVGRFMSAVINFGKPLVAAVNGPAIGVGCTLLPHCDVVYASSSAYFWTPFTDLAVCPEFCSSLTFPELLGKSLANEMLLFGKRLSVQQAFERGFVAEVLPAGADFLDKVLQKLQPTLKAHNVGRSLKLFKGLVQDEARRAMLETVHAKEMAMLDARSIGADSEAATAVRLRSQKRKPKKANL